MKQMRPALEFCRARFGDNPVAGAEIGVLGGTNAVSMLTSWPQLQQLHLVDSYGGITDQDPKFLKLRSRFAAYDDRILWHIMVSVEAAKIVAPGSLDYVYIDANHRYSSVLADCDAWWPVVRPGGVLCGHDYFTHGSVVKAVDNWARSRGLGVTTQDPDWWIVKGV